MNLMANAASDAFLQGQGIPVDPREIEGQLLQLWGPAAERVGGPHLDNPTVTRIVLANLVAFARPEDAGRLEGVIDAVVAHYPCRVIVMRPTDQPGRQVGAEVSALCHLPAPGMPQVCSERINLHAGPQALDLLPGTVRSLLETDLPFVLLWVGDPRPTEALFRDLADECTRLLLDLHDPGGDSAALRFALDSKHARHVGEIAWYGITPWRELVAQCFDPPGHVDALRRIESVHVRSVAPTADRPARAGAWLVAWLAGQLGWHHGRRVAKGSRIDATFRGPSGEVAVALETEAESSLAFARLADVRIVAQGPGGRETFCICRPNPKANELCVEVDGPGRNRMIQAPPYDAVQRLTVALEAPRDDPPLRRALTHALWLLGV
jgi:glucose-6-phosphate dehydrogenase assembly protein OpcA